jgi:hypothetical protein
MNLQKYKECRPARAQHNKDVYTGEDRLGRQKGKEQRPRER